VRTSVESGGPNFDGSRNDERHEKEESGKFR
jgi:hypothetical protein